MARQANKGFLLRLDPATMEQVEKWAAREFRSVNGQIQWIIAESLRRYGMRPPQPTTDDNTNDE
jgi:Uncharacterized protein conserved in bacteria